MSTVCVGVTNVIRQCVQLEFVDVTGCFHVSNTSLTAAIDVTVTSSSDHPRLLLTLSLGGLSVSLSVCLSVCVCFQWSLKCIPQTLPSDCKCPSVCVCVCRPKNSVECKSSFPFPPSPPFLPSPFLSLLLRSRHPQLRLGSLGERSSSPSGSGRSPAAKRILTHFRPKFAPFWVPNAAYCSVREDKLCPPSLSKSSFAHSNSSVGTQKGVF